MSGERCQVPIAAIDAADATFRITTDEATEALSVSIARIGLIRPPILRPVGGRFCVVSGFRRLAACCRLGWAQVAALCLPPSFDDWRCALWAVGENAGQRALNPVEAGRALKLLRDTAPGEGERKTALKALGLPDNRKAEQRLIAFCSLPAGVQRAVASGQVAPSVAETLGGLDPWTAERIASLMADLRLGLNKQRETVTLLLEIARAEGRTPAAILAEPHLAEILHDPGSDRARRSHRLRETLRRRRFPHLTEAERRFEILRRRLPLTPGADLDAPSGFEGRQYRLTLSFASRQELARHREMLDAILAHEDLERILALGAIP